MKIINVSSLTCPYANMQLLYPSIQFSTIGNPATLNTLSCFEWNVKRRCNKKNWGGANEPMTQKNYYLCHLLICNQIKCEARLWMPSPSNRLIVISSDTFRWSLHWYFRIVERTNTNNNLQPNNTTHFLNQVTIKNHNTLDDTKDAT